MKRLDIFGENTTTVQFDSIMDMARFIDVSRNRKPWSVLKKDRCNWNNNCDFDDAYKQMVFGYKYNQTLMDNLADFTDKEILDKGGAFDGCRRLCL